MKRALVALAYLFLLAVVVSEVRSIGIGLLDRDRYQAVFPGATGAAFWGVQLLSFTAGLNCVFIALRARWAILVNPLIGLVSIAVIEGVGGPRANEIIVLVASVLTTALPWYLWGRRPKEAQP